jgi:hypothetical protein
VFAGIGGNMGEGIGVGFMKAMSGVEKDMKKAIPTDFGITASFAGLEPAYAGTPSMTYNHTGTIRVEGINSTGEMTSVVDIIIDRLRQEVRV